jgi:hypothetical protein
MRSLLIVVYEVYHVFTEMRRKFQLYAGQWLMKFSAAFEPRDWLTIDARDPLITEADLSTRRWASHLELHIFIQ